MRQSVTFTRIWRLVATWGRSPHVEKGAPAGGGGRVGLACLPVCPACPRCLMSRAVLTAPVSQVPRGSVSLVLSPCPLSRLRLASGLPAIDHPEPTDLNTREGWNWPSMPDPESARLARDGPNLDHGQTFGTCPVITGHGWNFSRPPGKPGHPQTRPGGDFTAPVNHRAILQCGRHRTGFKDMAMQTHPRINTRRIAVEMGHNDQLHAEQERRAWTLPL